MTHYRLITFMLILLVCAPYLSGAVGSSGNEFNGVMMSLGRKVVQVCDPACLPTSCVCANKVSP
ncbi:hypothetical protein AAHE18_06G209500 [Arachis hypogaea]